MMCFSITILQIGMEGLSVGPPDAAPAAPDAFIHGIVKGRGCGADGNQGLGTDQPKKRQADAVGNAVCGLHHKAVVVK